jgi:hypothetical protein
MESSESWGCGKRVTAPSKKEIDGRWLEGSPMPSLFLVFSDTQTSKDRREKIGSFLRPAFLLGNRRYMRSDDTEIAVTQPALIGRLVIGWNLGSGACYIFLRGNWFNRG